MTVEELINELQNIEDKTLDVKLEYKDEEASKWVERVLEQVKHTIKVEVDTSYMARLS